MPPGSRYASLVVANAGAEDLVITGERLARPELLSAVATVYLDEERVGSFTISGRGTTEERCAIPDKIGARPFLNVRIVSHDYVFQRVARGRCTSFRAKTIELR